MAHAFEKCSNCGAPVELSPDGRSIHCTYCGVAEARTVDPGRLAASLRAESRSTEDLYDGLARTLAREFPDRTRLETSGGFFSDKRLEGFEVDLDDSVFRMKRHGRRIVAERSEVVRGITVKTEPLPAEDWVQALCEALSAKADSSAATLDVLRRIVL